MLRKKIGGFYLVEQLGSGGMSEVYLGLNPRTRQKCAFKIFSKSAAISASAYARFLREVNIMRCLSHPGIVKVLDSGSMDDCYYYSMEYMPGGTLSRRMEDKKIPFQEAVRLFGLICDAMAYAHARAVIHRDLKPSNVLLNGSGDPVISDFGIAKILDVERSALTQSGEILGTIAYLAPEQRFNSKRVNRRADVYALGAIFYEMLMGFPPLGKFPWPRDVHTDFPESLHSVLEKCLSLDPGNRFEHAGFLHTEIEQYAGCMKPKQNDKTDEFSARELSLVEKSALPPLKTDRIEVWFQTLRTGTTRERLAGIREMVRKITAGEAKAIIKLYPEEEDRVRWGLIRVLGELRVKAALPLILRDLDSPFHAECAIEALGKIGSDKAFDAIRKYIAKHPEGAIIAMLPMARTGKEKAIKHLRIYLDHDMAVLRQAAIRAIASIPAAESLRILKERLCVEPDEKVRSALFQSIRSLQTAMLPDITTTIQNSKNIRTGS
jgi:hypothetical protein